MYPRLKMARELLAEDGMIFISIDDHEQPNLRIICDEIFGEDNFLGCIVWDLGTGTTAGHFIRSHEYVLAYAKSKNHLDNFAHMGTDDVISHGALKKISQKIQPATSRFPKGWNTKVKTPHLLVKLAIAKKYTSWMPSLYLKMASSPGTPH